MALYKVHAGDWGELEANKYFQREACTRYLRRTLVFMGNSALRQKCSFDFSIVFC